MNENIVSKLFEIWKKQGDIMWNGVENLLYDNQCSKSIDFMMHDILENRDVIGEDLIEYLTEE